MRIGGWAKRSDIRKASTSTSSASAPGGGGLSGLTYEAGVEDITPACGTGSTAAAYVCARIGRTSLPVRVSLLGGELTIDSRGDTLTMHGPAEYMTPFAFEWPAEDWLLDHPGSADPELAAAGSLDGWS